MSNAHRLEHIANVVCTVLNADLKIDVKFYKKDAGLEFRYRSHIVKLERWYVYHGKDAQFFKRHGGEKCTTNLRKMRDRHIAGIICAELFV